jgi:hypothetical protein
MRDIAVPVHDSHSARIRPEGLENIFSSLLNPVILLCEVKPNLVLVFVQSGSVQFSDVEHFIMCHRHRRKY